MKVGGLSNLLKGPFKDFSREYKNLPTVRSMLL